MSLPEDNRQWDLMGPFQEWLVEKVYMWEIDKDTIRFANSSARKRILFLYDVWDKHYRCITKTYKKDQNHITITQVNDWTLKHNELFPEYTAPRKRTLKPFYPEHTAPKRR